jgi:hypothetical protein
MSTLVARSVPRAGVYLMGVLLAALAILWACSLPAVFGNLAGAGVALEVLMLCAAGFMATIASAEMRGLSRAVFVLGQQQLPHALWHQWLRAALRRMSLVWAMLSLGIGIELTAPLTSWHALSAPALLSVVLCLGAVAATARSSLLPRLLVRSAELGMLSLVIVLALTGGPGAILDGFGHLPPGLLILLACAWPALGAYLLLRWGQHPPQYRWSAKLPPGTVLARIANDGRRFTVLARYAVWVDPDAITAQGTAAKFMPVWLLSCLALICEFTSAKWHWFEIGASHLAFVAMLGVSALNGLIIRDLHWHTQLLPGGLRRGRIASRIMATTLSVQFAYLLVFGTLSAVVGHAAFGVSYSSIGANLWAFRMLPLEIVFVTSIAVLLRTFSGWISLCYVALLVAGGGSTLVLSSRQNAWTLEPGYYAIVLLLLSMALLACANRAWTMNTLDPFRRLMSKRW